MATAEGVVQKYVRQTYGRHGADTYYDYKLDLLTWIVSPEAYRALIEGQTYRVYCLPRSKQLLGIDPIEQD